MSKCTKEGFCVAPRKEREIQVAAEQLRKVLSDHCDLKYLEIVKVLEFKMPEAFQAFRYEVVDPSEMPDHEAEMSPLDFCIRIQEPIYERAMEGDGHCRFTIAHELGHFFLHRTQTLAFGRKAVDGNIPTCMNSEWQADVFARNLLAPFSLTRGMSAKEIEVLFGVSRTVANIIAGTNTVMPICRPDFSNIAQMTFNFA